MILVGKKFEDLDIVFGFIHRKAKVTKDGEEGWLVWDSALYNEISFIDMETEDHESLFTSFSDSKTEEEFEELLSQFKVRKESNINSTKKNKLKFINKINKKDNIDDLLADINNLVGLNALKKDLEKHINLVRVQKMREVHGLPQASTSLHMVFTGNPGTGKTTVARLLSKIYNDLGILSKGHMIETDRSGLVAEYIGHTALKVHAIVEKAIGGVLFIDEAYSLSQGGEKDFGREAIDTLIKLMEDHREELIIIVAGYPNEMKEFIDANPGMRSRFNKYINFEDYNELELKQIFELIVDDSGYILSENSKIKSLAVFKDLVDKKDKNFGNGRDVRNIFEKVISNQADRVAKIKSPSKKDLSLLIPEDLEGI